MTKQASTTKMTRIFSLSFFLVVFLHANEVSSILVHKSTITGDPAVESGDLYLQGKAGLKIPDVFSYIADNKSGFKFIQRDTASGKEGFFPVDSVTIQQGTTPINDEQMRDEFYQSRVRLANTPEDWMYGVCSAGTFFFSARGLFRLVHKYKPLKINRNALR